MIISEVGDNAKSCRKCRHIMPSKEEYQRTPCSIPPHGTQHPTQTSLPFNCTTALRCSSTTLQSASALSLNSVTGIKDSRTYHLPPAYPLPSNFCSYGEWESF